MEVLGLPNGTCEKPGHGAKLSVNGEAQCVKCTAEAARATRTHIPVVTVEDPGEEAFASNGMLKPGHKPSESAPVTVVPVGHPTVTAGKPVQVVGLLAIREAIYRLPMPKSIKQYKRFQKIQSLIDEAVSEEQNG